MKKLIRCFLLLTMVACSQKRNDESQRGPVTSANDFPTMQITLVDGETIEAKNLGGKTVLILFQPDCDHCQHEAKEIEENISAFRDHNLYFISSSSMPEIKNFANTYKLSGIPNVFFGWTSTDSVIKNFGPIQAPSIYIYTEQGKLVKQFNGQVGIGEVLKYL